ncbi:uncharacterized protein LOC124336531 [Daphnia pulicaria]|uniref:uncharacterized protein LOC124336531 n=1 Tax=Daphnia pulicaria TaxID=35523 RepID=UPI001EE9FB5D|nr:uncharacterized protein LOC124336531 [Daphnia pulicaria]XP_046646335.1 uncharacterized protein LOC124336531 [Daphnia pulicaria]
MIKIFVLTICSLLLLVKLEHNSVEATKSNKSEKGFDYDGKENGGESDVGKGQHHKILFQEPKKFLLLTRDHIREATAYGAGGGYSLQIQVAVPLQTPYSSKRGGSGGYEGSASAGDSEVPIPVPV